MPCRSRASAPALALTVAALVVCTLGSCSGDAEPSQSGPTTRSAHSERSPRGLQAAAGSRLLVGTAVNDRALATEAEYRRVLADDFGVVTPENAMKWAPIHPEPQRYDWAKADRIVDFAHRHGQQVRGHALVWHNQLPKWLTSRTWTRDQLMPVLRDHIRTVVGHYRGRVGQWDVVNEPLDESGNLRHNLFLDAIGPDYVDLAFRWAHEADPSAQLFVNDYFVESAGAKADGLYRLVESLVSADAPIDGVGFQAHGWPGYPSRADLGAQLERFGDLGLATAVTELDIRVPLATADAEPTNADLAAQAATYAEVAEACRAERSCRTVAVWGFTDAHSWVPDAFTDAGAACLLDADLQPKPAYRRFREALGGR